MVFAIHWHESAMDLHAFPLLIPPPTSLPIPSLWVTPMHQPRALVSCIQPGLAICFTLDNIHVLMLFSQIIPLLPSPTEFISNFKRQDNLSLVFNLWRNIFWTLISPCRIHTWRWFLLKFGDTYFSEWTIVFYAVNNNIAEPLMCCIRFYSWANLGWMWNREWII